MNKAKATEAQIKAWKADFGEVFEIEVRMSEDENDKAYCYVKKPSMDLIQLALKHQDDLAKSGTILYNNCIILNDDRINNSDEAKMSVFNQLFALFEVKVSTIKKL